MIAGAATDYDFAEEYSQSVIAAKRAEGLDGAELEAELEKIDK